MKKGKLERDEGKTFPCSQLILSSSCFEEGFSRIHRDIELKTTSAVALEKDKKSSALERGKQGKCVVIASLRIRRRS
jgi:hypothetical protein